MKSLFLTLTFALLLTGCKKETPQPTVPVAEEAVPDEPKSECYLYNQNGSVISIRLSYNEMDIGGEMTYALNQKDHNYGTLSGQIKDSILIADYEFISEGTKSTRQVAFKFNGNQLLEGFGEMNGDGTKFKDVSKIQFNSTMPLNKVPCAK